MGNIVLEKTSIDYDMSFVYDINWNTYKESLKDIMTEKLKELHKPYGGMPTSYNYDNTVIYQKFLNRDEIDYELLGKQTGLDVYTISVIQQRPGNCIPLHIDKFYKLKKLYPDSAGEPVRANIYIEDWKAGHILQFEDELKWEWKKNTGWIFNEHVKHLSGNCGMENKYTLQLSGFFK